VDEGILNLGKEEVKVRWEEVGGGVSEMGGGVGGGGGSE